MLRYQLTVRKPPVPEDSPPPGSHREKFHGIKSAIAGFLALSAAIGILLAAVVVGSVLAIAIIVVVGMAIVVWLLSRVWRRKKWQASHRQERGSGV